MSTGKTRKTRATPRKQRSVLVLSGPNLQLLGVREPEIYGTETLEDVHARLVARGAELGVRVTARQSNHEGQLCDWIAEARTEHDGILLNAAAYTHTSLALFDAIKAVGLPCVEVHISNPEAREAYRHVSRIAPACVAKVSGFGTDSYLLALEGLVRWLERSGSRLQDVRLQAPGSRLQGFGPQSPVSSSRRR